MILTRPVRASPKYTMNHQKRAFRLEKRNQSTAASSPDSPTLVIVPLLLEPQGAHLEKMSPFGFPRCLYTWNHTSGIMIDKVGRINMMQLSLTNEREPGEECDIEDGWIQAAQLDIAAFEPLYLRYRERI